MYLYSFDQSVSIGILYNVYYSAVFVSVEKYTVKVQTWYKVFEAEFQEYAGQGTIQLVCLTRKDQLELM